MPRIKNMICRYGDVGHSRSFLLPSLRSALSLFPLLRLIILACGRTSSEAGDGETNKDQRMCRGDTDEKRCVIHVFFVDVTSRSSAAIRVMVSVPLDPFPLRLLLCLPLALAIRQFTKQKNGQKESPKPSRALAHLSCLSSLIPLLAFMKAKKGQRNPISVLLSLALWLPCSASLDGWTSTPGGRSPYTHMRIKSSKKRKKGKGKKK